MDAILSITLPTVSVERTPDADPVPAEFDGQFEMLLRQPAKPPPEANGVLPTASPVPFALRLDPADGSAVELETSPPQKEGGDKPAEPQDPPETAQQASPDSLIAQPMVVASQTDAAAVQRDDVLAASQQVGKETPVGVEPQPKETANPPVMPHIARADLPEAGESETGSRVIRPLPPGPDFTATPLPLSAKAEQAIAPPSGPHQKPHPSGNVSREEDAPEGAEVKTVPEETPPLPLKVLAQASPQQPDGHTGPRQPAAPAPDIREAGRPAEPPALAERAAIMQPTATPGQEKTDTAEPSQAEKPLADPDVTLRQEISRAERQGDAKAEDRPLPRATFVPPHTPRETSHVVLRQDGGAMELSFEDSDIGRVELKIHETPAGTRVDIASDRAESLDAARRQMAELQRDFRQQGYGEVSFHFGGDRRQSRQEQPGRESGEMHFALPLETGTGPRTTADDRLDLRM